MNGIPDRQRYEDAQNVNPTIGTNNELMKIIELTQGEKAVIDEADFSIISQHNWCTHKIGKTKYAATNIDHKTIHMHRLILGIRDDIEIDHIDGNGLNNKRENLRFATKEQNRRNRVRLKDNVSSIFRGVYWHKKDKRWQASIKVSGKTTYLGQFKDEISAALAYDDAARKIYKEFARPNF